MNTNHLDGEHQTPIFYAAREDKCGMIRLLVQYGANVNHKDKNHQTCLFYAAREGRLEACKLLVQLGIEVQHQDKKKKNAASFARERNHRHVVEFLNSLKQDERKGKEIDKVSGNKVPPMSYG
jgi:ankyrin repeat protein